MKTVLTHFGAALLGGTLVFLIAIKGSDNSADATQEAPGAGSRSGHNKSSASSRRTERLLARTEANRFSAADDPGADTDDLIKFLGLHKPTDSELEEYILERNGDPEALIAAGMLLNDPAYFRRALEKDPNNLQALLILTSSQDTSPKERLELAERFRKLQPNNAMASYLLATNQIKAGKTEEALETLRQSTEQTQYDDFSQQNILVVEEALRGTGNESAASQLFATWTLPLPQLFGVLDMVKTLDEQRAGLEGSDAEETRRITASMGARLTQAGSERNLVTELVGIAVQKISLRDLPEDAASPFEGLSVADANASFEERRDQIRAVRSPDSTELAALTPLQIEGYANRLRLLGEFEANRWLNEQTQTNTP